MRKKHPWLISVGQRIRKVREDKGISQEKLAELVGIDRSYIGGIERGERNVATLNLIRIAIALDTEVGYFFPQLQDIDAKGNDT